VTVTLGSFGENYISSTHNWATFFNSKSYVFYKKKDLAVFCATFFSKTHPVTLLTLPAIVSEDVLTTVAK
jgi:hypothetical protein